MSPTIPFKQQAYRTVSFEKREKEEKEEKKRGVNRVTCRQAPGSRSPRSHPHPHRVVRGCNPPPPRPLFPPFPSLPLPLSPFFNPLLPSVFRPSPVSSPHSLSHPPSIIAPPSLLPPTKQRLPFLFSLGPFSLHSSLRSQHVRSCQDRARWPSRRYRRRRFRGLVP